MVPSEKQITLFRAVEDIQDLTQAIVVILVDEDGLLVAASGDENDVPAPIRAELSGKKLAAAGGSARTLLSEIVMPESPLNVSIFAAGTHVLAIVFDAESDLMTVQQVGSEARDMLVQLLAAPI